MDLASVRIITDKLDEMVEFYEGVTGVAAERACTGVRRVSLPVMHSCNWPQQHGCTVHNAARPAENQTVIVEWVVDDVDTEFQRLKSIVGQWEQEPTLMPWGNRSILFRDPDGNLVNLFTLRPTKPSGDSAASRSRQTDSECPGSRSFVTGIGYSLSSALQTPPSKPEDQSRTAAGWERNG